MAVRLLYEGNLQTNNPSIQAVGDKFSDATLHVPQIIKYY